MRTYVAQPSQALPERKWWVVDADGQPLGRLASKIATILRGKNKATFTPHVDTGDFVIVVNASKVKVTGSKADKKIYYTYSGYPGGMKSASFRQLSGRKPDVPIRIAVRGMLPKTSLGRRMLGKLKIYGGAEHPHVAQKPQALTL